MRPRHSMSCEYRRCMYCDYTMRPRPCMYCGYSSGPDAAYKAKHSKARTQSKAKQSNAKQKQSKRKSKSKAKQKQTQKQSKGKQSKSKAKQSKVWLLLPLLLLPLMMLLLRRCMSHFVFGVDRHGLRHFLSIPQHHLLEHHTRGPISTNRRLGRWSAELLQRA